MTIAIPVLMFLFWRTERYYGRSARSCRLGLTPPLPHARESIVIVPTSTVNLLTERALSAALSLGDTVVAVAVAGDEEESERIKREWAEWSAACRSRSLIDPHRSLVRTVLQVRRVDRKRGRGRSPC